MKPNAMTVRILVLTIFISICAPFVYANESERQLKVMTYNMYLGTEVAEVFGSQTVDELLAEVAEAYVTVQAGNPPERIDEIADQIATASPHVVGLQEVALWRYGYPGDPASSEAVAYDFLQILLEKLKDRGAHYAAISIQTNLDAELTGYFGSGSYLDVRYTDRDVIIARTDLPTSELKIEGTAAGAFQTRIPVSILGSPPIFVTRGWTSADIKHRGKTYRFVNAHLEAFSDLAQYYQAYELLQGPTNSEIPVILTGDFNTDPSVNPQTYSLLLSGGFSDVWPIAGPVGPGFTWPLSAESVATILTPTQRVDYIMTRGAVRLSDMEVVGDDESLDLTPSLLRPSDHAGLTATVVLEP